MLYSVRLLISVIMMIITITIRNPEGSDLPPIKSMSITNVSVVIYNSYSYLKQNITSREKL